MHQRAKKEKDIPTDQKQNRESHETHFPLRALSKPSELKHPFFFSLIHREQRTGNETQDLPQSEESKNSPPKR